VAALLAVDNDADFETNVNNMLQAISTVKTFEITRATRSTRLNGLDIKKNQAIGLLDGELLAVSDNINSVVIDLLAKVDLDKAEIITFYYGAETKEIEAQQLSAAIRQKYPKLQARGVVVYYDANQPPDTPSDVSPADAATEVSLTPTLESSVFSDPDAVDIQAASQWQITVVPGDYSSPVFDSGTDSSNLTSITIPTGILEYAITYYWHVRHQDSRGAWSEWSAETSFTTEPEPVLLGDADGDGVISALDITSVERIIARLDSPTAGADANQDGKINALDITKIERLIAGLG
jgi:hypothetical protein